MSPTLRLRLWIALDLALALLLCGLVLGTAQRGFAAVRQSARGEAIVKVAGRLAAELDARFRSHQSYSAGERPGEFRLSWAEDTAAGVLSEPDQAWTFVQSGDQMRVEHHDKGRVLRVWELSPGR